MRSPSEQTAIQGASLLGDVDSSILETAFMYANEGKYHTCKTYLASLSLDGQQRVLDLLLDMSRFLNRSIRTSEEATVSAEASEAERRGDEQYTREL